MKLLDAIRDTWKAISFHLIDYLSITNSKVKFYLTGNPTSIEKRRSIWISSLVLEKKIQPGVFSMTKTINHNYNLTWLTSFVFCLRLLFRLFIFTGSSVASPASFDPVIASFTTFQISIFRIFETILNVLNRVNALKLTNLVLPKKITDQDHSLFWTVLLKRWLNCTVLILKRWNQFIMRTIIIFAIQAVHEVTPGSSWTKHICDDENNG